MKDRTKYIVCELHCKFYKKDKKEEYACKGFHVIENLLDEKKIPEGNRNLRARSGGISFRHDEDLKEIICRRCDFFIDGCDFRDQSDYISPPCGGFILISYLLENGIISKKEIENP